MEKGYNSDISYEGFSFHVQTEDWGLYNPYLVSQVYQNGAIKKRIKTPYSEVLPNGSASGNKAIQLAMRLQHQSILDLLLSGQLL